VSDERRDHVRSEVRPLAEVRDLPEEGEADLRYRGQSFELTVALGADLVERFHRLHEERYGYADPERELELVAVRTAEINPGPKLELPARGRREARGPTVIELDGATCWLPPGWVGVRDGGIWRLTRA
jgi:N-methylhydantoinase A/oxoprolinase/acetone carboxylase beta subunit